MGLSVGIREVGSSVGIAEVGVVVGGTVEGGTVGDNVVELLHSLSHLNRHRLLRIFIFAWELLL